MKMKKVLALVAACAFAVLAMAGCGSSNNAASSGSGSGAKVLKVGSSIDFAPFEFQDEGQKEYQGFDMDLIRAVAKEMGYTADIQNLNFDGLIPALSTGKVDMIIAGMNPTEERKQSVDFTDIYYTQKDALVIKSEDAENIQSENDLKKASLATQKATIQETYLLENFPDAALQSVPKWNTAILSLVTGKVDAVLMVETVAKQYVEQNEGLEIAGFDVASTPNESAIAVAKDNKDFLDAVNDILDEMKESGQIEELMRTNIEIMDENTVE